MFFNLCIIVQTEIIITLLLAHSTCISSIHIIGSLHPLRGFLPTKPSTNFNQLQLSPMLISTTDSKQKSNYHQPKVLSSLFNATSNANLFASSASSELFSAGDVSMYTHPQSSRVVQSLQVSLNQDQQQTSKLNQLEKRATTTCKEEMQLQYSKCLARALIALPAIAIRHAIATRKTIERMCAIKALRHIKGCTL